MYDESNFDPKMAEKGYFRNNIFKVQPKLENLEVQNLKK